MKKITKEKWLEILFFAFILGIWLSGHGFFPLMKDRTSICVPGLWNIS